MPIVKDKILNGAEKARLFETLMQGLRLCDDLQDYKQWRTESEEKFKILTDDYNDEIWKQTIIQKIEERKLHIKHKMEIRQCP